MGKWFPKLYDILMKPLEKKGFAYIRKNLIHTARGRVLEIGSGTGLNFPYYQDVESVVAVEPNSYMREQSTSRVANNTQVSIEVINGDAQSLPFPDGTFDTVVCTLALCTIPNPYEALGEIRRVCRSNGHVLFFEHVRLHHPILGRIQDLLTPPWKYLCDGCHLNRRTSDMIGESGLKIVQVDSFYKGIFLVIKTINQP